MSDQKEIKTKIRRVVPVITDYLCECGSTYKATGAIKEQTHQMLCLECGDLIYIVQNPHIILHIDDEEEKH